MKRIPIILIALILSVLSSSSINVVSAANNQIVYFKESTCTVCNELQGTVNGTYTESKDYLKKIEDAGFDLIIIDILPNNGLADPLPGNIVFEDVEELTNADIFTAFNTKYGISSSNGAVPIIFAGEDYYLGLDDIISAFDSGALLSSSNSPLLEVEVINEQTYNNITGIAGFITVLFAGLLDGFNPCAIALLLLFVSLLGFSENKKILVLVSITYIFALFISYFLIGTLLYRFLLEFQDQAQIINTIVSWFIALLCSFLFLFNLYDFFITKNEQYGKVKNQLPKWIQKFNKKIINTFTNAINDEENKKGLGVVLILTFVLGVTLSVTELICTGQIYLGIIYGIQYLDSAYAYLALLGYNIMFIIPLVVIAVIAIRGRGIMTASNWIREHLHVIKLANAILFLVIATYYFFRIF